MFISCISKFLLIPPRTPNRWSSCPPLVVRSLLSDIRGEVGPPPGTDPETRHSLARGPGPGSRGGPPPPPYITHAKTWAHTRLLAGHSSFGPGGPTPPGVGPP